MDLSGGIYMNSIEEDITKIDTYIELVLEKDYCNCNELNTILGKHCDGSKNVAYAIEHILKEYKRVLKENEQLRTEVNSLKKENKELKTITNQYEAYECEAPKDSRAKIIIADKLYFNNGYFKNNFIEIDKIKKVFEDLEKIIKAGE